MNTDYGNYTNHGPIDRDAQRLIQEMDVVRARTDRRPLAPGTARHPVLAHLRAAVGSIREVLSGIAAANERYDRINRPWMYEGSAWVHGSHGAVRTLDGADMATPSARLRTADSAAGNRSSDASGTGLRPAC